MQHTDHIEPLTDTNFHALVAIFTQEQRNKILESFECLDNITNALAKILVNMDKDILCNLQQYMFMNYSAFKSEIYSIMADVSMYKFLNNALTKRTEG